MSNYLLSKQPLAYGGQQSDYIAFVATTVNEEIAELKKQITSSSCKITDLFFTILESLRVKRHEIAIKHNTRKAHEFGQKRDRLEGFEYGVFNTKIIGRYEGYDSIKGVIQGYLRPMEHSLKEFTQKERKISGNQCFGKQSSVQIEILSFEVMKEWSFFNCHDENLNEFCTTLGLTSLTQEERKKAFNDGIRSLESMRKIKEQNFNLYKKIKLSSVMPSIRSLNYDSKQSDWVLVTPRLEIGGKMVAMSQYLTWMCRDYKEDPVDKMSKQSMVTILHQDLFLIDMMLKDISKIFERVILLDSNQLVDLKNEMALFEYELAHAAPFSRGSAAISEWFVMILYGFHGYNITHNPDKMSNMEALTLSLKDFVDSYDSIIAVEKIQAPTES